MSGMTQTKPRNAFRFSFDHTNDQPPDPLSRRLVLYVGLSILLSAFAPVDAGALRDFLGMALAQ